MSFSFCAWLFFLFFFFVLALQLFFFAHLQAGHSASVSLSLPYSLLFSSSPIVHSQTHRFKLFILLAVLSISLDTFARVQKFTSDGPPLSLSLLLSLSCLFLSHSFTLHFFFLFFLALSDPHPGRSFSWKTVTHFSCISFFFVLKQTFLSQEITLANYGQWSAPLLRITTKKHVQQRCDLDFSHTLDLLNNLI